MGYPKKHRGRRKIGSKKEEQEKETNESSLKLNGIQNSN